MLPIIITVLIVALFIADVFFVEYENFGWTTFSLLLTGCAIYYFNLWGMPAWVKANAPLCFAFVGAYVVMGVVWSFVKWYSYLVSYRDKFLDIKNRVVKATKDLVESQLQWAEDNQITFQSGKTQVLVNKEILPFAFYHRDLEVTYLSKVEEGKKLVDEFNSAKREYSTFYKPEATSNKGKIVAWICYWPFSLIGTFINDPIRRLVNFLFTKLKATYQKMSDKVFKDFPDKHHL